MELVRDFKNLGKSDVSIAGGKGASLGEMTQAGIPVPGGFVILSSSFNQFIEETEIKADIDSILHKVNTEDVNSVETASEKIKAIILSKNIPKNIEKEILSSFKKLNSKFVAVRSSATSEDSSSAAWAGQLESYLNTTSKDLLENVKKCWASLFTPRAIFYRFEKNLHSLDISVAVVVQKMVESEVSGIAFSVHPVTQDYNQLIIEAGLGLGESIVSGQITPDSYVIEKDKLLAIEKTTAEQTKALIRAKEGGNIWINLEEKGKQQKLTDKQILELSKLIIKIENHYNFPCDIEWAFEKGKFYIVQSRPITTLTEKKQEKVSLSEEFLSNVKNEKLFEFPGEFVIPFVTLDWLNYYDNELKMKNIYPALFFKIGKNGNGYLSDERYANVAEYTLKNTLQGNFPIKEIKEKYEKAKKSIEKDYKKWNKINSSGKIEDLINKLKRSYYDLKELVASTLCIERLDQEIVKKVVSDLKLKVDLDKIWKIANIQDFTSFDIKNKQEILKYCKDKREIMKLQFIYINYTFIPDKSFLEKEIKNINLNKIKKEIEETKKLVKENKKEVNKLSKSLNKDEKKLLTYLKWAMSNRDERKEFISKSEVVQLNAMSEIYSLLGLDQELVPLTRIEDILKGTDYLLQNQEKIRKRKDKFGIIWYNQEDYREIYENIEQEIEILSKKVTSDHKQEGDNIRGETGCRGKISGKVKIIISSQQFKDFKEGEILVAPMTRPEFVPLMKKASAIITDEGGITSHAAIVSRELKIPCVIGTKIATKLLKNGDEVEVDADNGIIKILNKKEQLTLTKYMSREHSLFYAHVWNEANRDLFDQTIPGSNVKNMIFLLNKKGVLEVYYDLKELDRIFNAVSEGITKDPKKLDNIIENFYIYWNKLLPYIKGKKKVESTNELKEFYHNWVCWWAPMADIFVTPDKESTPKKLRDKALKVREETQEYSDDGDRIFTEFISKKYPKYKDFANLFTPEEAFRIDKLSNKEIESIKQRKNGCAILTLDGKSNFVSLEELDKTLSEKDIIRGQLEAKETNQLSGLSACPGIVQGKIRLVLTKKDLDKVQKGEIMVTYATSPDYVPAMKLCSGIITDEGGVVCHAAIVSRELKIPCVVGTKLATSTLKNGDLVELDANKGIVRIIKKAK